MWRTTELKALNFEAHAMQSFVASRGQDWLGVLGTGGEGVFAHHHSGTYTEYLTYCSLIPSLCSQSRACPHFLRFLLISCSVLFLLFGVMMQRRQFNKVGWWCRLHIPFPFLPVLSIFPTFLAPLAGSRKSQGPGAGYVHRYTSRFVYSSSESLASQLRLLGEAEVRTAHWSLGVVLCMMDARDPLHYAVAGGTDTGASDYVVYKAHSVEVHNLDPFRAFLHFV